MAVSSFVNEQMSGANEGMNKAALRREKEAWDCEWWVLAKTLWLLVGSCVFWCSDKVFCAVGIRSVS
ncbi:hypothetical protein OCK74_14940 [Chitinophagaceae bacterium LB-8]|uniref:Uncharacterized protein n=1 Tax=Paraflavisolibacter caeni TaxID=2982496 RepID=A0A9X3B8A6_9BACT|nr:hypothetical protein [Paraflavisolibacter caeni]MCU7550415.1 hypothetical protein [Paraflavisolibacter caeni]